jgi:hypothetical protein
LQRRKTPGLAHLQAPTWIDHILASVLTKYVRRSGANGSLSDNTVLSPRSTNPTAPPGEQSRKAAYVISCLVDQNDSQSKRGAHLVGCKAIVELNHRNLVPPLSFWEPCLREDLVGTSPRHGEADELHCAPRFKRFNAICHQRIPCDLYCLVFQPMLMDKILRCNDTTRCTVLGKVKLVETEEVV